MSKIDWEKVWEKYDSWLAKPTYQVTGKDKVQDLVEIQLKETLIHIPKPSCMAKECKECWPVVEWAEEDQILIVNGKTYSKNEVAKAVERQLKQAYDKKFPYKHKKKKGKK